MRMTEIIRRTFHGTKGMTTSVLAFSSSSTTSRLKAATPWPRRTASLINSHAGNAKRRVGTMPSSAKALSATNRVAEPSSREIQVSASRSCGKDAHPRDEAVGQ